MSQTTQERSAMRNHTTGPAEEDAPSHLASIGFIRESAIVQRSPTRQSPERV